jgi:senataxin
MQASRKKLTNDEAKKLLQSLRDEPVTTQGAQDNVLAPLYDFVQSFDPGGGELHWFCGKAFPVVTEASIFLLRLFAYSSDHVTAWKNNLIRCLHGCCACVKVFEESKETSRKT